MDPINHTHPAFGFDQSAFDSQAFHDFANLDAGGPFNTANGFTYEKIDSMVSFDECYASIPLDGLDQSSSDNVPMLGAFNSGQPYFNAPLTQSALNVFNQYLTDTAVNGAAQLSETASSNGSGQAALSASASFDSPNSTIHVNDTHQLSGTASHNGSGQTALPALPGYDKPRPIAPLNRSAQPASNNLPLHAPHRQVPYDLSIGTPYTLEDNDSDKIRKWENLIAHADLANAGVPASASQIIEEESAGQSPQTASSSNSLFDDGPRSPSVEIVQTPSPTPSTPSPSQAPAPTIAPSKAANNVAARATPQPVQLPRALTHQKNYAQHVSPFAPVATVSPLPPLPQLLGSWRTLAPGSRASRKNETITNAVCTQNTALRRANAKHLEDMKVMDEMLKEGRRQYALLGDRFNELAKDMHKAQLELNQLRNLAREHNYDQPTLRNATSADLKSGKIILQMLQTENGALRRVKAKQARELRELKEQAQRQWAQYVSLGDQCNDLAKQLYRTLIELKELKGEWYFYRMFKGYEPDQCDSNHLRHPY
ncbi:hypothetical protein N7517_001140 [Penicillium concentricum]|uniref:Uncharacterized protein n=1 Tax=Penicillium concentricum TaxID=293559 RepID=A0A9W9VJK6_9EURO|nr:uncharacterized protein N7517_001140 [Penicillium concentricum]KAJ5383229.1 hypothetical protein N7517_001140 [Penicillium concentricum]